MRRLSEIALPVVAVVSFVFRKIRRSLRGSTKTHQDELADTRALVEELVRDGGVRPEDAEGLIVELVRLRHQNEATD